MDLGNTSGRMGVFTKVSSEKERSMAMESGEKKTTTRNMKASFKKIESKVTAYTPGQMETFLKETIMLIYGTGQDKCTGMMVLSTKDHGSSTNPMEKGLSLMVNKLSREALKMGSLLI